MRIIDVDVLEDLMQQCFDMQDFYFPAQMIHLMGETPTVDAVPIVRCQNCRCWKQHTAVDIEGNLVYLDSGNCGARVTNKDDYCSLAVRREEAK